MMGTSYIDNLLSKIDDESLRNQLTNEFNKLRDNKEFGLVFERHIPEYVRLYKREITEGAHVQLRASKSDDIFTVREVQGKKAVIADKDSSIRNEKIDDLVVVIRHGDSIYPGLVEVDRIERGGDKPFHTVINAENYHALQLLLYTHEGKVDCIYIDPPYNTGAKDWKYNNDYVDSEDRYRHSKWLSFMEKRLLLAKKLLNPASSGLILTIDEKEYRRVGILLEQIFPSSKIQMVSSVINAKGIIRANELTRTNEFVYFVSIGEQELVPELIDDSEKKVRWASLRRTDIQSARGTKKGGVEQFYPIYVNDKTDKIEKVGDFLTPEEDYSKAPKVKGCTAIFPIREKDNLEMNWGLTKSSLEERLEKGYVKLTRYGKKNVVKSLYYLTSGVIDGINNGEIIIDNRDKNGVVSVRYAEGKYTMPTTQWNRASHNAQSHGSDLLKKLIPDRRFPFPKSIHAVEDAIRIIVGDKKNATVLDFFGGSGTTTHAVMRLNKQDGGKRQSILITNNAVSADEEITLTEKGLAKGDIEWEDLGIFHYITKPRIKAAVSGLTIDGSPLIGEYQFAGKYPLSIGLEENVVFCELNYLNPDNLMRSNTIDEISIILWLITGSRGSSELERTNTYSFHQEGIYGVLFDVTHWQEFVNEVSLRDTIAHAFIITDSKVQYQQVVKQLPTNLETTMLYEDYLRNFQIGV